MELSTMRNETINAFQKEFEIFSTYFTHVQQSLMLCPILLTEKIHRIASIISKNYMTPRKPYKINKVRTTNIIEISSINSKVVINNLHAINEVQYLCDVLNMYVVCNSSTELQK